MRKALVLILFLLAYAGVVVPFSGYMREKPVSERVGFVPHPAALRVLSADHRQLAGALLTGKVLFYYGALAEKSDRKVVLAPDMEGVERLLGTAVRVDPYNMDAYYFGQAFLVWDAGRVEAANALLEYGMDYRDWDFYLPFFAGFNYAYFLKDYESAAEYYRRAGALTGSDLFMRLAGRYLYEAGRTQLAIGYLSTMSKSARNETVRRNFELRLEALQAVREIEKALEVYRSAEGHLPSDLRALTSEGYLEKLPVDPYGGNFYLTGEGQVRTTSEFAFAQDKR